MLDRLAFWPFLASNQLSVAGIGFWLNIFGFGATWFGLWLAWKQLRAAATALQSTSAAIERVKFQLYHFEDATELATAGQALDQARVRVEDGQWIDASHSLETVRRSLIKLKEE